MSGYIRSAYVRRKVGGGSVFVPAHFVKTQTTREGGGKRRSGMPPYLKKNLKSLQFGNPRGSATRGWKILSPKKGRARHAIKAKCGNKAFLLPSEEKFPVMTLHAKGCHYDCRGLTAALSRAQQHGYHSVAARARSLKRKHCHSS
jgi:hypothetical protein